MLVHPVAPVLNETRHIVKLFNAALRTRLQKEDNRLLQQLSRIDERTADLSNKNGAVRAGQAKVAAAEQDGCSTGSPARSGFGLLIAFAALFLGRRQPHDE